VPSAVDHPQPGRCEGLAERRKFVVAGDHGDLPVLRMDFNESASALDTLLGE
jgi:hypothetical protein